MSTWCAIAMALSALSVALSVVAVVIARRGLRIDPFD